MKTAVDKIPFFATVPNEIFQHTVKQCSTAATGMFAKTSRYYRSNTFLIQFERACKLGQHEIQLSILTDIYSNCSLLTDEKTTIPIWCNQLDTYRKGQHITLLNRLLATAILLILDKDYKPCLEREFMTLLLMQSSISPQIANSVLAILATIRADEKFINLCEGNHNIHKLFGFNEKIVSPNEMRLLMAPFRAQYSVNNFYSKLIQKPEPILNLNTSNFIYAMSTILKLIPDNHIFWKKPNHSVRDLMCFLFEHNPNARNQGAEVSKILVYIQSRLKNANFLSSYLSELRESFDSRDLRLIILSEASHSFMSEKKLVTTLKEHYKTILNFPSYISHSSFISRMARYMDKLKEETNIIAGLNILFSLLKSPHHYMISNAIQPILLLFPKITSQQFVFKYIWDIFVLNPLMENHSDKDYSNLSSICKLSQASQNTASNLLIQMFDYFEENIGSKLQYQMATHLCSHLESNALIENVLSKISLVITDTHKYSNEWFDHPKNFMYFECLLVLSKKMNEGHSAKKFLDTLFMLIDHEKLSSKAFELAAILLPDTTGSPEIIEKWIGAVYKKPLHISKKYTTNWSVLSKSDTLISNEIKFFENTFDNFGDGLTGFISLFDNIAFLLLNAPEESSKKVSDLILDESINLTSEASILKYIDEYSKNIEEAQNSLASVL